jgi:hypothetical protein
MTEKFTHNMKIVVADHDGKVLSGEFVDQILSKVYAEIANKVIRKEVYWTGTGTELISSRVDFAMLWSRKILKSDVERLFIGNLFTTSMVCDSLLYDATGKIIWGIEQIIKQNNPDMDKKWTIVYHISKLLDARTSRYESYIDMFYNPS